MSKLELTTTDDITNREITYTLTIPGNSLALVKLSPFDQLLFDDIDHGKPSKTPIADKLLGLETLVRRIEEQQ